MEIKEYNKKDFLLPNSIRSMAAYHAKIMPDGKYLFRIHDCITGIRLNGDLNDQQDVKEAVDKLNRLSLACNSFAKFIYENYLIDKKL
jgi:hypothetical protein